MTGKAPKQELESNSMLMKRGNKEKLPSPAAGSFYMTAFSLVEVNAESPEILSQERGE